MKEAPELHDVMMKYSLAGPVDPDIQGRILRSKKHALSRILAVETGRGFFAGWCVQSYYLLKRITGGATMASAVRTAAMAVFLITSVTAGGLMYFAMELTGIMDRPAQLAEAGPAVRVMALRGALRVVSRDGKATELTVGGSVMRGDRVVTGAGSFAYLRTPGGVIAGLDAECEAVFPEKEAETIMLIKGTLLSASGEAVTGAYTVKTPVARITPVGTRFGVTHGKGETTVFVTEGAVKALLTATGDEMIIGKGESAVMGVSITRRPITGEESQSMEKLVEITVLSAADPDDGEALRSLWEMIERHEKKSAAGTGKAGYPTLEEMRTKCGRIDEVILYSGRILKGRIVTRGETMRILTPGGMVRVKSTEVRTTEAR